jgi:hypothetical protein
MSKDFYIAFFNYLLEEGVAKYVTNLTFGNNFNQPLKAGDQLLIKNV